MILSSEMPQREVMVAGETLIAQADGSLFWPAESTLFVADIHFGKAASFRAMGVPVPVGTTAAMLDRLSEAIRRTNCRRLVFLGDLWHAKEGRKAEIIASLQTWRESHSLVDLVLVEGNHDRRAGPLPPDLVITTVQEPLSAGPFALCHYPTEVPGAYCLAGHLHPAVALSGKGRQSMRLPCFWFGDSVGILPAFGDFTGTATIEPRAGDQVLVIADEHLHMVGATV